MAKRLEVLMLKDFTFERGLNYMLPESIARELQQTGHAMLTGKEKIDVETGRQSEEPGKSQRRRTTS